jgi:penicillin-binding protein 2
MRKLPPLPLLGRTQVWILAFFLAFSLLAGATEKRRRSLAHRATAHVTSHPLRRVRRPPTEPAHPNSGDGDSVTGEDLTVRRITLQALGSNYGSVVVVDSSTGRVLSILNQKVALGDGFQPCSTFKVSVALAALSEKVIAPGDPLPVGRANIDLTDALAHSNNHFFANLGCELGFEKVSRYAHQFGYGERAGENIAGERAGHFPPAPPSNGGVGRLSSFGEEIGQTPLQFAALMGAIANGGTLYCLQYPRNAQEAASLTPKVKRKLRIEQPISGIIPGLRKAVEGGTARSARQPDPIAGKTGTCSEDRVHLGWFGAFNSVGRKLVVVVLLMGGHGSGPRAAGVAGEIYRQLSEANYLVEPPMAPRRTVPVPRLTRSAFVPAEALILMFSSAILIFIWRMLKERKRRTGFGH